MDWYHAILGLVSAYSSFTLDEIFYPAGWLLTAPDEQRKALGFYPVQIGVRPNEIFYVVVEQPPVVENDVAVIRYTALPRDIDLTKASLVSMVNNVQASILAQSDWVWTRKQETGKEPPEDIRAYRAAVRQAADDMIVAINACGTIGELEFVEMVWPPQ